MVCIEYEARLVGMRNICHTFIDDKVSNLCARNLIKDHAKRDMYKHALCC